MIKNIHFNKPQLTSYLIGAHEETDIWGRGTGKSQGLIAPRTIGNVFAMPRSLGVYVASTYQQLLTRTLPPVIAGLTRLGYEKDVDYFFGQFAPKKWNWETPFLPPVRADYFIHFRNGSGIALVSQDRPGSANGLSIDWIIGDEAKFIKEQKFKEELLPANRGHNDKFGHLSQHHSILLTSDMPTFTSGMWILKNEEKYDTQDNRDRIELVMACQIEIYKLNQRLLTANGPTFIQNTHHRISSLNKKINWLRKGDIDNKIQPLKFFSRASALDNLAALGTGYIDQMKQNMPELLFRSSILNEELKRTDEGFYPDLDDERHGYDSYDNSYLDGANYDFDKLSDVDCRHDGDVMSGQPLDIALDYGASFNCMVVGQDFGDEYKLLNGLHVKHPLKIRDLIRKFKKYYQHHRRKAVHFYYDHTAKGENAIDDILYYEEVMQELRKDDVYGAWQVYDHYIGSTPTQHSRFELWGKVLNHADDRLPKFKYNRNNCQSWALSCAMAPVIQGRKGFEKDKRSERKGGSGNYAVDQEKATHYSDAGDTLIHSIMAPRLSSHAPVTGGVMWGQ